MRTKQHCPIKETNITIMVKDIDESINFYKKLGLKIKNRWDNYYATLASNDITIGLHTLHAPNCPRAEDIGLKTNNISHTKAYLKKRNIKYKPEDSGSEKYLRFKDPDGTPIFFMQSK